MSGTDAKANAEALVPKFKFERLLNQGAPDLPRRHGDRH